MRKSLLVLAAALLSGGAFAAPYVWSSKLTTNPASEVKTGGVYRAYNLSDFQTVNPFVATETPAIPSIMANEVNLVTGLFRLDPTTNEYVPYMAESYKVSANKLEWTVNIRKGMKWSDGKPITADDWVTTAKIHSDENVGSNAHDSFFINGKQIKVAKVDEDTVKFTFPSVAADAIELISYAPWPAHVFGPVYASKGAAGVRAMWTVSVNPDDVVTAGPFVFSGYRPGERVNFTRNKYFGEWNKDSAGHALPYLDGVQYTITKDTNSAFAQFMAGTLDTVAPRNADDLAQIKKAVDSGQLKAVFKPNVSPTASSSWIVFNWNRKSDPFKQNLFR
ncbi:MAG TPA: ABC transporter substrate-binding protein, partial [Deinococcales bacterium]|nr:ABC transporter substrate-binding protein [Deinococcales bacterium]